jgi:hypothetical protein
MNYGEITDMNALVLFQVLLHVVAPKLHIFFKMGLDQELGPWGDRNGLITVFHVGEFMNKSVESFAIHRYILALLGLRASAAPL